MRLPRVLVWRSHKSPRPFAQIIGVIIGHIIPARRCIRKNDCESPCSSGPCLCPCLGHRVFVGAGQARTGNPISGTGPCLASSGRNRAKVISQLQAVERVGIDALGASEAGVLGNSFSSGVFRVFWLVIWLSASTRAARAGRCAARICEKGEGYRPSPMRSRGLTLRMLNSVDTSIAAETRCGPTL